MFTSKFFHLHSGDFSTMVEGEEFTATTAKFRNKMIGTVIEEDSGYTQLMLDESGIVMVTKVDKNGKFKSSREHYSEKGELRPLAYKETLHKLWNAFETHFETQMDTVNFAKKTIKPEKIV
ncbi:hypothetical protein MZM54_00240 [[Brevibacterium] frigoritolerans]|nr:hypothetical protein [Peribacillus frigoritolerans]